VGQAAAAGVYRGIAQTHGFGSYVAAVAEVSVSKDGVLKIHRIVRRPTRARGQSQQIEARSRVRSRTASPRRCSASAR